MIVNEATIEIKRTNEIANTCQRQAKQLKTCCEGTSYLFLNSIEVAEYNIRSALPCMRIQLS